jgi:hypothetical protein
MMGYTRLYDGTVAADYDGVLAIVEKRMFLPEGLAAQPPSIEHLLVMVNSPRNGILNESQVDTVGPL